MVTQVMSKEPSVCTGSKELEKTASKKSLSSISETLQLQILFFLDAVSRLRLCCSASSFNALKYREDIQALTFRDRALLQNEKMLNLYQFDKESLIKISTPSPTDTKILKHLNDRNSFIELIPGKKEIVIWFHNDLFVLIKGRGEQFTFPLVAQRWPFIANCIINLYVNNIDKFELRKDLLQFIKEAVLIDGSRVLWKNIPPEEFTKKALLVLRTLNKTDHLDVATFCVAVLQKSYSNYSPEDRKKLERKFNRLQEKVLEIRRNLHLSAKPTSVAD